MPLLNIIPNTPDWHEYRKDKIGASLAPVIMGDSPWQTPYQLWEEMLGISKPREVNAAMERGTRLEEDARHVFMQKMNCFIRPCVYRHDHIDWMFASLDGFSLEEKIAVEIKCPNKEDHLVALNNKIPQKYFAQVQHQLAVTNLDAVYYVSYDGKNSDIAIVKVYRDEDYIQNLIQEELVFIKRVKSFDAPPLCDKDIIARSDVDWEFSSIDYVNLLKKREDQKREELDEEIEQARKKLIDLADGKNCKGFGVSITKITRKGAVDYAKIPELRSVDLELYRKGASSYWKITAE